jgi:hypothetical protein
MSTQNSKILNSLIVAHSDRFCDDLAAQSRILLWQYLMNNIHLHFPHLPIKPNLLLLLRNGLLHHVTRVAFERTKEKAQYSKRRKET